MKGYLLLTILLLTLTCIAQPSRLHKTNVAAQQTGKFYHAWDPLKNSWKLEDSTSYTYDLSGKVVDEIYYLGDSPFTGKWIAFHKLVTTYNTDGNIKQLASLFYNGASWDTSGRDVYSYDAHSKLTLILSENFKASTGWSNYVRSVKGYDANGNVLTEETQYWNATNSVWEINQGTKITYTYDSNNFMTSESYLVGTTSGYNNLERHLYINNASGRPLKTVNQGWDGLVWQDVSMDSSIFSHTKLLESYRSRKTVDGNTWERIFREKYTYHTNGKILEFLQEYWDTTINNYSIDKAVRVTAQYNQDGNITKALTQNWNKTSVQWVNRDETIFYYNGLSAMADFAEKNIEVRVYPNPFVNGINVEVSQPVGGYKVSLTDITGRVIMTDTSDLFSFSIDTQTLVPGIYILKVGSANEYVFKKIMKSDQ